MISPLDTRIAFFGGAARIAAIEAVVQMKNAGYDVVAASHDPREAPLLQAAGIPLVTSRAEALDDAQVVLTALANPHDVEDLYLGENGLVELVDEGTYLVDLSVSTPQLAREIHAVASVSDVFAVDAPVVNLGEREQAVAFLGGDAEALDALSPLYPYLAPAVYPQSDAGEGQFAAMVANIALAGSLMGAVEAMALAHIAGFSDKAALSAIAGSSGGSRALIDYIPRVMAQDFSGRLSVSEFLETLGVALDAAESLDVTIPMVETAYQLYELLSMVGGDDLNVHALALLYEDEKTCGEFGLDWSRADDMSQDDDGFDDYDAGFGGEGPGPRGCPGPFGGFPPMGGMFSKN